MKLSICMMVKNESKYLDMCLKSLNLIRDSVDSELIIVDTGSTDSTVEIAKKYTDKVYFHKWNNNFSEMRNISISYSSGEWIFYIDGDEIMYDSEEIINFLNSDLSKEYNSASVVIKNITRENTVNDFSVFSTVRLMRKHKDFCFKGAIHNQPIYLLPTYNLNTFFLHYGYNSTDKELMEKKFKRTATILKDELKKDPNNIYYWYQLSVSYGMHKNGEEALNCSINAFELLEEKVEKKARKNYLYVYTQLAMSYISHKNLNMTESICNKAIEVGCEHIDLYYLLGKSQMLMRKDNSAIESYEKYLITLDNYQGKKDIEVQAYSQGKREYVYFDLFILYKRSDNVDKALEYFSKIKDAFIILSEEAIEENINLYLDSNNYSGLKNFYNIIVNKQGNKDVFILYLEKYIGKRKFDILKIKEILDEKSSYNYLLNFRMAIENNDNMLLSDAEVVGNMSKLNLNNLNDFYGDILYYYMKYFFDEFIYFIKNVKEKKVIEFFKYLNGKYDDFLELLLNVLYFNLEEDLSIIYIKKITTKYLIAVTEFDDINYKQIFDMYVKYGIDYVEIIYNTKLLENEQIYYLQDEEESFFVYMRKANLLKNSEEKKYLYYLKKALNIYPYINRGIKLLLDEFKQNQINTEMESYKTKVIENIKILINENKLEAAKELINEYEKIICNDPEIENIKSIIL